MYLKKNQLVYSPSDITLYLESPFASWMEHLLVTNPEMASDPDETDPINMLLQEKGNIHEVVVLDALKGKGFSVAEIVRDEQAVDETIKAMQEGKDIIFQACLVKGWLKGYADFLVKVKGESIFGDYQYEVWDTKLSKSMKPYFIIQLCCYAEMLKDAQGVLPVNIAIILGDSTKHVIKTNEFYYYYLQLKSRFFEFHDSFNPNDMPDPMNSKKWGRWESLKNKFVEDTDHLSQVANITRSQIKKLSSAGIKTMTDLASVSNKISGIDSGVLSRLRLQAELQIKSKSLSIPKFEVLNYENQESKGLALLPPLTKQDVYFDIEGAPLVEDGLEYLWGVAFYDESLDLRYLDFWAHNHDQEKYAFTDFISWVYSRWKKYPAMHIFHYGHYEIAACRRLMGRYGIYENEVDELLRNNVFVDLYSIVKASIQVGEPAYSIKNIERLYRSKRDSEVGTGMDSVVVYERWHDDPDGLTWESSKALRNIRDYNKDDCNSTAELVCWLANQQLINNVAHHQTHDIKVSDTTRSVYENFPLVERLLEKSDQLLAQGKNAEAKVSSNIAGFIDFHRREDKPIYWRYFDRLGKATEELYDDADCLAGCERTPRRPFPSPETKSCYIYEYKFNNNQEYKKLYDKYYILDNSIVGKKLVSKKVLSEFSDYDNGLLAIESKEELPASINLVPDEIIWARPIPETIFRMAEQYLHDSLSHNAILDFLRRSPPSIQGQQKYSPIVTSHDNAERLQQIINAVKNLNNSYLPIQGPPGSGKTYTASHIIVELLKQGKKIGISSVGHKTINNLLLKVKKLCNEQRVSGYFACTNEKDDNLRRLGINVLKNNQLSSKIFGPCVIGTTAWGFAREDFQGRFDYLFIDEAGQVSVANLFAMSQSANNLILIGDQMQLPQPSRGTHPEESGLSILDYLLNDKAIIPSHMGVLLEKTYRMHSSVNKFISHAIYEDQLVSDIKNDRQLITIPDNYIGEINKESGIIYCPVEHDGNLQASDEEVEKVKQITNELIGRQYTNKDGVTRVISTKDILYVVPYNYQVNKLKHILGEKARVGSVDKFQGQEAPIVILSMCSSDASESPRGVSFLFSKNRLNVAISRAQCLAIIVASTKLVETTVSNINQMAELSLYCELIAAGQLS